MQEKTVVSKEIIGDFLNGKNESKYIVAIETSNFSNKVHLIINEPNVGKRIENYTYKPFLWCKEKVLYDMYGGDKSLFKKKISEFGIKFKKLKMSDEHGNIPKRMLTGYQYLVFAGPGQSYSDLCNFFKFGGCNTFGNRDFYTLPVQEQFLIQTGKRMFKGFEDYDNLHKFYFDLETTGLDPYVDRIFSIGIKDNKGFEHILEIDNDDEEILKELEIEAIDTFFSLIEELQPDNIAGYNSENFDMNFFVVRCQVLGIDITKVALTLSKFARGIGYVPFKRNEKAKIKLGQDTESYTSTLMWGYNILDIAHSVRRAQAINSDIKSWSLKYVTKYAEAEKPNRVYVPGDKLFTIWRDTDNEYAHNKTTGEWYVIDEAQISKGENVVKQGFEKVRGKDIVDQYLKDDLWETAKVDDIFNQANFLLGKIMPTSFQRVTTMGTAAQWQILMTAWSYEHSLAIPSAEEQREFTGGLSRLLEVGFSRDVIKLDFAALYPNITITHNAIPDIDISGVMKGFLIYIAEMRDLYKEKKNEAAARGDKAEEDRFDKLQLPLKILANSFYGAFGSVFFNWGSFDCAEEITCRGRQYLRLMVKHFTEKYGFSALVLDTDGVNFRIPPSAKDVRYVSDGTHRFNKAGKEYTGSEAVVAEFNDKYMPGRMGLDIDEYCDTTINFMRKNYANHILKKNKDGSTKLKLKIVGNTFKNKNLPGFVEEFFKKAIPMLLTGNGEDFLKYYYKTVEDIYNQVIPLDKIATKARVKQSVDSYINRGLTKNGLQKARQAHMELIIDDDLDVDLGDTVYYINVGTSKSHGDIKTVVDAKTGEKIAQFNCRLIPNEWLENPDLIDGKISYNVPKYLDAFNKRVKTIFTCFRPEIRDNLPMVLITKTVKKIKTLSLSVPTTYTREELDLYSGKETQKGVTPVDDYQKDLMDMEDKELRFWTSVKKEANNLEDLGINLEKWEEIKKAYYKRSVRKCLKQMIELQKMFRDIVSKIEWTDYLIIRDENVFPVEIEKLFFIDVKNNVVKHKRTSIHVGEVSDIFEFTRISELRHFFYLKYHIKSDPNKYKIWEESMNDALLCDEDIEFPRMVEIIQENRLNNLPN